MEIPDCFYRVSVKALILNETRDKFLICQESDGRWGLPGGGLDWGETPEEGLAREIKEEMGLKVTKVDNNPFYFTTSKSVGRGIWLVNVVYEANIEHLDFTPSAECVNVKFVDRHNVQDLDCFSTVHNLIDRLDPEKHRL